MPTVATEKEKWAERIARKAEAELEAHLVTRLVQASAHLAAGEFATEAHANIARHRDAVAAVNSALRAA